MTIAYWLGDSSGPAADLAIDPYSKAEHGEVILTGTTFVDAIPRWPQLFSYSQANIFTAQLLTTN
jgi:hypothetical protein